LTWKTAPEEVLGRLERLRQEDAPAHGGRMLAYVYDSGDPRIDALAAEAIRRMQPVNGLDPTTFRSVAVIEREVVAFSKRLFHGGDDVVGTATTGGTESCLLAVKTARDAWRAAGGSGTPRVIMPITAHAAFRKAAALLDVTLDIVSVDPGTGRPDPDDLVSRLGQDAALVVLSAPCYPFSCIDPIAEVAPHAAQLGVPVHVDACLGGFALGFWDRDEPGAPSGPWDFGVRGVTSLSADLHKYGYAPKGVSVLLQRGRDRQRHQWFATSTWPGYPVVNSTLLGSKSAAPLAAAWAIISVLGPEGFRELTTSIATSWGRLRQTLERIEGLQVVGDPVGPMLSVATDPDVPEADRVDPHHWADAMRRHGFIVQHQPRCPQPDGSILPATAHVTITPVTKRVAGDFERAARAAADDVRGMPHLDGAALAADLLGEAARHAPSRRVDADTAAAMIQRVGLSGDAALGDMAPVLALVEALPPKLVGSLVIELLARRIEG